MISAHSTSEFHYDRDQVLKALGPGTPIAQKFTFSISGEKVLFSESLISIADLEANTGSWKNEFAIYDGKETFYFRPLDIPGGKTINNCRVMPGNELKQVYHIDDFLALQGIPILKRNIFAKFGILFDLSDLPSDKIRSFQKVDLPPEYKGRPNLMAISDSTQTIVIDTQKGNAIVERTWVDKNKVTIGKIRILNFQLEKNNLWIGRKYQTIYYPDKTVPPLKIGEPYMTYSYVVDSASFDVPDPKIFVPKFPADTFVEDFSKLSNGTFGPGTKGLTYIIPDKDSKTEIIVEEAIHKYRDREQNLRNKNIIFYGSIISCLLLLILLFLFLKIRRKQ